MAAGTAALFLIALLIGAIGCAVFFRQQDKAEERKRRIGYYRRLHTDIRNAGHHYSGVRGKVSDLSGVPEIEAAQRLEDAKFAARGMLTYDPSDLHYVTEAEAARLLDFTLEVKHTDAQIDDVKDALLSGSNAYPAKHAALIDRIDGIAAEARHIEGTLKPRAQDYFFSE